MTGIAGGVRAAVAAFAAVAFTLAASAQEAAYPSKAIHLVIGSAPGDQTDVFARVLADDLKVRLGQPIIVENKPGAAGLLGASYVANAKPDGYTLLFGHMSNLVIGPQVIKPQPYDATKAFTPIAMTQQGASVLVVKKGLNVKSIGEFMAQAKEKELIFGLSTIGSTQHLVMELVQAKTGVRFNTVTYNGTAPSLRAVVTGEADFAIASVLLAQPHVENGTIVPIAMYSARKAELYPDLPTMADALSIPEIGQDFWFGVVGPAGLDAAIVRKLWEAVDGAMQSPVIKDMLAKNAQVYVSGSPESFGAALAEQWKIFGTVARDGNIEVK